MNNLEVRVQSLYSTIQVKCDALRKKLSRPLTLTEKILATHVTNLKDQEFKRGESYLSLQPDRVAM